MEGRNFHTAMFGGFRKKDVVAFLAEDKRRHEEELEQLRQQIASLESELENRNAQSREMESELQEKTELQLQLDRAKQGQSALQAQLMQARQIQAALQKQLAQSKQAQMAMQAQLARMREPREEEAAPQPQPQLRPQPQPRYEAPSAAPEEGWGDMQQGARPQPSQRPPEREMRQPQPPRREPDWEESRPRPQPSRPDSQESERLWELCGKLERTLGQMERMLDGPYRMTCYPDPPVPPDREGDRPRSAEPGRTTAGSVLQRVRPKP